MGKQCKQQPFKPGGGLDVDSRSFPLHLDSPRRFDPIRGTSDVTGPILSLLTERAHGGDWSWKPLRDKALGKKMVTYVPARHPLEGIRF
jgi:hypothetical protein